MRERLIQGVALRKCVRVRVECMGECHFRAKLPRSVIVNMGTYGAPQGA